LSKNRRTEIQNKRTDSLPGSHDSVLKSPAKGRKTTVSSDS